MFYPSKFPHNPNVREFYSSPRSKSDESKGMFEKFLQKFLILFAHCEIVINFAVLKV